jgi:CubicO group peptidase (beta-lactamase class C family)
MGPLDRVGVCIALLCLIPTAALGWLKGRESQTYSIGPQPDVVIDGDLGDWKKSAFTVGPLADQNGRLPDFMDLDGSIRVGWNRTGLVLALLVRDDVIEESPTERLGGYDSVSIRISEGLQSERYLIATIAPGADPSQQATRVRVRAKSTVIADVTAAGRAVDNGYQLETHIPLQAFGPVEEGQFYALQVILIDRDPGERSSQIAWFPWEDISVGGMSNVVQLAQTSSASVRGLARGDYPDLLKTRVTVTADRSLAGREVAVLDDKATYVTGYLSEKNRRAEVVFKLDMPDRGAPFDNPRIKITDSGTIPLTIRDSDEARAWGFVRHGVEFEDYAFGGERFPEPKLADPLYAEHLIGPYTVEAEYYDRNYNKVDRAEKNGRYGAVVSIKAQESGFVHRRFRTLYKHKGNFDWWEYDVEGTIDLPDEYGIEPVVLEEQRGLVSEFLKWRFRMGLIQDQRAGAFLAGLSESIPGKRTENLYENVWTRDREWWVGLKRKLYGLGPVEPLQAPTGVFKGRAQELVFGSESEAGFREGVVKAVDQVCKTWWEESAEPFSVCLARNGYILHLQSYGVRDGEPVTLTTKTPIASITKLLAGTLMAMAVEHRRLDLDAPIKNYLPAFRDIEAGKLLTVRKLMNHTSGLHNHWGDDQNDFEELMAGYASEMQIGRTYQYNGTAFALAGKVLEAVTGETVPRFLKRHLLDPLGCEDTDVFGTSWDGKSTPLDLARIGQMLMNGGAYGDFRFFEYEAMQELLPKSLMGTIPGTYREYGMGTRLYRNEGFGEGTFGHGAASSTIFRVDPENKLVIVVTRWREGKEYNEHRRRLFDTIVSYIPGPKESL